MLPRHVISHGSNHVGVNGTHMEVIKAGKESKGVFIDSSSRLSPISFSLESFNCLTPVVDALT